MLGDHQTATNRGLGRVTTRVFGISFQRTSAGELPELTPATFLTDTKVLIRACEGSIGVRIALLVDHEVIFQPPDVHFCP